MKKIVSNAVRKEEVLLTLTIREELHVREQKSMIEHLLLSATAG